MGKSWRKRAALWCTKGLLAAVLAAGCLPSSVWADDLSSDQIRVGLFLDLGTTYKSTTSAVTISSGEPWQAGFRTEAGFSSLLSFGGNEEARFSIDGFRVKVLETQDLKTAAAAFKKLETTADKPLLFAISRGGATVYQLYCGMYASEQAANDAAVRAAKTVSAQLDGQTPVVKGNKHVQAGVFATEAEAKQTVDSLAAAGFDAMPVLQLTAGSSQYAVWVGEAANEGELDAIRNSVGQALPNLSLSAADISLPSLIIRQDAGFSLDGDTVKHYELSGSGAKLWIDGNSSGINVAERSQRTYRGGMEISLVNGQLALVNELPFEQYLYAVVGGEVPSSWPMESLKAQAVAARSYAKFQESGSSKFKVADVVDTTLSQAYNGISAESPSVIQAVDATQGQVLKKDGKLVESVFSSNAGGASADATEVWNSGGEDIFTSVPSKEDESAQAGLKVWYHVLLSSGISGYVREDNVKLTGSNTAAGLGKMTVTSKDTNVRPIPLVQSGVSPIAKMNPGDTAVVLDKVLESGSYFWIRGPYTSADLEKSLKGKTATAAPSKITTLEVTKRGPSGRVTQIKANGQILDVKYPDMFRSAMNGLPSTLFDIVPTGSYTVLGANGQISKVSASDKATVVSASGTASVAGSGTVVMNGDLKARSVDSKEGFLFIGYGNGHGLGLSQWGAKGMADAGYGYEDILKHYYQNVTIVKE